MVLISVLALLVLINPPVAGEAPPGFMVGNVTSAKGRPIVGARVWLPDAERPLAEARTGPDGRYRLGPLKPVYRHRDDLFIEADGYGREYVREVTVFPGADNDLGRVTLAPGRRLTGTLIDMDGKPRPGVRGRLTVDRRSAGYSIAHIGPGWELTTDSAGTFRTPALPAGELVIEFHLPDRRTADVFKTIPPGAGDEVLEPIRLEKDVPILGMVRDEHGDPVPGANIAVYSDHQATSGPDGRFTLRGFGPKPSFQPWVKKPGFASHTAYYRDVTELAIALHHVGWISGRATDGNTGKPVRLTGATLCPFDRRPDGSIVRRG